MSEAIDIDADQGDDRPEEQTSKRGPTQAAILLRLVEGVDFFHDPNGTGYATFTLGDHSETWPLRSRGFRSYLERAFYEYEGSPASAQAIQDAIGVMDGRARFEGFEHPVHVRVAGDDEVIHLDLGGQSWQSVVITRDGWAISPTPLVKFRRPRGMAPLPMPSEAGDLSRLQALVNVADRDWPLVLGWMVGALRPAGPKPVLASFGEQGSAKSTTQRIVRTMLDPATAPLRSAPRNEHELVIAAENNYVIAFDNASTIQPWLSDAFARIATGAGFAARQLYSDNEEMIFAAKRPVLINGIEEVVTRPDLLDRALIVEHPKIPATQRTTEADIWEAVTKSHPAILGGLLDALAVALRNLDAVELNELPRMADFAEWVVAAEPSLGWEPGRFIAAYTDNRDSAHEVALESSPVAAPLREIAEIGFEGTSSDLLALLSESVEDRVLRLRSWPKTPKALSGELRRLAPNLRETGVSITFERTSRRRVVRVAQIEDVSVRHNRHHRHTPHLHAGLNGDADDASHDASAASHDASDANDASDAQIRTQSIEVGGQR
jgi:hypothetical protein